MKSSNQKVIACVLGVGIEPVGLTSRYIYELPDNVTSEIQDILIKHYESIDKLEPFLKKKLNHEYK